MYDASDDPYTYKNSTVLINKLGLRRQLELSEFEAEITSARADEALPAGNLDFSHFCAVHHHLLQDVYDWAGEPRTVRISKDGNAFCFPEHIALQADRLFSEFAGQDHLKNMSSAEFARASAHFLAELNAIHAFREGNGRTQLSFFMLIASRAGHPIDLEKLDPDAILDAMIASFRGDERQLAQLIEEMIE